MCDGDHHWHCAEQFLTVLLVIYLCLCVDMYVCVCLCLFDCEIEWMTHFSHVFLTGFREMVLFWHCDMPASAFIFVVCVCVCVGTIYTVQCRLYTQHNTRVAILVMWFGIVNAAGGYVCGKFKASILIYVMYGTTAIESSQLHEISGMFNTNRCW